MKRILVALPVLLILSGLLLIKGAYTYYLTENNPAPGYARTSYSSGSDTAFTFNSTSSDGETKITLPNTYGSYSIYLDSTGDPFTGNQFLAVRADKFSSGTSSGTISVDLEKQGLTTLASASVTMPATTTVRAVFWSSNQLLVYLNDQIVFNLDLSQYELVGGNPGVGVTGGSTTAIATLQMGSRDYTVPNAISSGSITKTPYVGHIDLSWPSTTDDTNGIGLLQYEVYRDGNLINSTTGLSFSDTAGIVPGHNYSYQLRAVDQHLNYAATSFSVTTPTVQTGDPYPSTTPEGRRVGVRPTGAYWGAGTENIDVMSGNLNFALPLVSAVARGGGGVGFSLAYNSQNFRWNANSTNTNFGKDVGYGFGWTMKAGSIVPVFSDPYTITHYVFTNSSGAEYNLNIPNVPSSGVWYSKESAYIYFVAAQNRLYFTNGSFWQFDCVSAAGEPDQGVLYPTLIQDINGNQVKIRYKTHSGATWEDSSARLDQIEDIRAGYGSPNYFTYSFEYNTDTIPHLIEIESNIGDGLNYTFGYLTSQSLSSPFNSASYGSSNVFLQTVTANSRSNTFAYNSSGEITGIDLPLGGDLDYEYATATYASGVKHREVWKRQLTKESSGGTPAEYVFTHEASPSGEFHEWTQLDSPVVGNVRGRKKWEFGQSSVPMGLVTRYQGIHVESGTPTIKVQNDYTWSLDTDSRNSYISQVLTTKDPGEMYAAESKVEQIVNVYGGVTRVDTYDYADPMDPIQSNTYTYGSYPSRYVYNVLTSVTDEITSTTNMSLTYGSGGVDAGNPGYYLWDSSVTSNLSERGLPIVIVSLGKTTALHYTGTGALAYSSTNGVTSSSTYTSTQRYAVPTQISVSGTSAFTQEFTYDSLFNVTGSSNAAGATTSATYDSLNRPYTTTGAFGATATATYGTSTPKVDKVTVNGRWTRTTADGLGRPVKVESGYSTNTVVSIVDTEYDSCGCSPTGKVYRTSLPYASGGSPLWTTNTYDGIGRTLTTTTVGSDTSSRTEYVYEGNTVKVIDAAGKWKKYTTNILGQLTQVNEQNPAGSGSDYITYYTYDDPFGHLTKVEMPRPSGTQVREFEYNSSGQLTETHLPESGTTAYEYNSDNTLKHKIDANGKYTGYTYDAYKRPIKVDRGPYGTWNKIEVTVAPEGGGYITAAPTYLDSSYIGTVPSTTGAAQTFTYYTTSSLASSTLHVDFLSWYYYLLTIKVNGVNVTPSPTGSEGNYDFDVTLDSELEDAEGVQGDVCQREEYTYGTSSTAAGRLVSGKYRGGYNSGICDTSLTEFYTYSAAGAVTQKRVRVERGSGSKDLDSTYTYDNEGRNTGVQYPPTWNSGTSSWDNGPNRTITYDDMGRLSKLTNATTSTDIVSATTYNAMGQLLTMTGVGSAPSEARVYNSLGQMKELTMGSLHMEYNYPGSSSSPVNNGKINSEANVVSGETVTYTYDYLNRLATATSSDTPGWGQSFAYDGFGNLSTVSNIKGTVPTLSVTYDDETNRRTSDCADANGNLNAASACYGTVYSYDIANRIVGYGSYHYSYAPGNKRVWRGNSSISLDELTYYSAGGAKLVTYDLGTYYSALTATASGNYYEYFGGKLLKNSGGWVNQDRLGSIGKFFPYGQERPSATSDGTEKFATYFRDSETGLDYAQNRYHDPGEGRFMTPDPFDGSISLGNPGSWNRYTYVGGDPINRGDPSGLCDVIIGGITQSDNADFGNLAGKNTAIQAYPYAGGNPIGGIIDVAMLSPDDIEAQVAFQAIMAAAADPGAINIVAYSGGAGAFTIAYGMLTSEIQSRISSVTYLSPGANGPFDGWLPGTQPDTLGGLHFPTAIVKGAWILSNLTEMNTLEGYHSPIQTNCGHTDTACLLGAASTFLKNNKGNPCSSPAVYSRSKNSVKVTPGFGPHWNPQVGGTGGGSMGLTVYDYWAWQNNMYASAYFEWSSWMAPYWAMAGHGSFNYETAYRIFNPELAYPTQ